MNTNAKVPRGTVTGICIYMHIYICVYITFATLLSSGAGLAIPLGAFGAGMQFLQISARNIAHFGDLSVTLKSHQ